MKFYFKVIFSIDNGIPGDSCTRSYITSLYATGKKRAIDLAGETLVNEDTISIHLIDNPFKKQQKIKSI